MRLISYVKGEDFVGWDPYDGLNSRVLRIAWPLNKNPLLRLAWIQFFKRSPINLRRLFLVPKGTNPKAVALFVSGYTDLFRMTSDEQYLDTAKELAERLLSNRSPGFANACWGYNFDWQAKSGFKAAYVPTGVVTSFGGYGLLDLYDITRSDQYLDAGISAARFMVEDLNRTEDSTGTCFSYSPNDQSQVYNASLLVSRLLSRVYSYTSEDNLANLARASVAYCCARQSENGSWVYSPESHHQWVDSFHTGFNLECVCEYAKHTGDSGFAENLTRGLQYYLDTFFTPEGMAKYYNDTIFPVDVHAVAQLFVTLRSTGLLEEHESVVSRVLLWTVANMQDESGYFYYQHRHRRTNRIPYMRWSQAWMFYGLSRLLRARAEGPSGVGTR